MAVPDDGDSFRELDESVESYGDEDSALARKQKRSLRTSGTKKCSVKHSREALIRYVRDEAAAERESSLLDDVVDDYEKGRLATRLRRDAESAPGAPMMPARYSTVRSRIALTPF